MTFSLVARCAQTGRFGMVVSSSSPAVAARCSHARAGVGAAASQNVTDPTLGPRLLDLMAGGMSAPEAMARTVATAPHVAWRQLLAVDAAGRTAAHSGASTLGINAVAEGQGAAAAGNLLANPDVPAAMLGAFAAAGGDFVDRLVAALRAGRDAGGEAGPVRSAGLVIVDRESWPAAELRCDWSDDACPIEAVARAWAVYAPQMAAYLARARDPEAAPAFGVPGERR